MFVPLEHPPGDAQADFGQAQVVIAGRERIAHYFAMDLPQLDDCFVMAFPAETNEAFLEGHNQAFAYFGGVPRTILPDNAKLAVAQRFVISDLRLPGIFPKVSGKFTLDTSGEMRARGRRVGFFLSAICLGTIMALPMRIGSELKRSSAEGSPPGRAQRAGAAARPSLLARAQRDSGAASVLHTAISSLATS